MQHHRCDSTRSVNDMCECLKPKLRCCVATIAALLENTTGACWREPGAELSLQESCTVLGMSMPPRNQEKYSKRNRTSGI
jgi:hypothetical protein